MTWPGLKLLMERTPYPRSSVFATSTPSPHKLDSRFVGLRVAFLFLLRHLSSANGRLPQPSPTMQFESLHSYCILRFRQSSSQPVASKHRQDDIGKLCFFQVAAASPMKRS